MFTSLNLASKTTFEKENKSPETAGTLASKPINPAGSIFSTETAGSVAFSSPAPASSGSSFSAIA